MSDGPRRFHHASLQDAKSIKTLLGALSKGFAKGEMTLGDDDQELVLKTADLMTVRIKAEHDEGHCSLNLRVTWSDPGAGPVRRNVRIDS